MKIQPGSFCLELHRLSRVLLIGLVLVSVALFPNAALAGENVKHVDPIWGAAIDAKDVPAWLTMLDDPHRLYSEYELPTLAGHLINDGVAHAADCPGGGLKKDGTATACGVERAQPEVLTWQNSFNADIIAASQQTGVPPIFLKNIFAWESEFWPRTIFINTWEFGLGHMTSMGADSLLRWNYPFYDSFCNARLSKGECNSVYVDQEDYTRAALQGLVLIEVNADCTGCTHGLDLQRARTSLPIFANTLIANAKLVQHYIKAYTGQNGGDLARYEDLWDFTLASYNAGPGCFKTALSRTLYSGLRLTWKNLSTKLDPACQGSIPYVKFVSDTGQYHPEDEPSTNPTPTSTNPVPTGSPTNIPDETLSPVPTSEPIEGPSATATATQVSPTPPTQASEPGGQPTATPADTAAPTNTLDFLTPLSESTNALTETPAPAGTQTAIASSEVGSTTETSTTAPDGTGAPTASGSAVAGTAAATGTTEASPTTSAVPTAAVPDALTPLHVGNELVVKIDPQQREAALQSLGSLDLTVIQDTDQVESPDTLLVQVDPGRLDAALGDLVTASGIEFAEPNYLAGISSVPAVASPPNDPLFPSQNGLLQIQVPQAWEALKMLPQDQQVIVAVLDTGVDLSQPDLVNSIWQNPGETGTGTPGPNNRSNGKDDDQNGYVDDLQGWNFVAGNNDVRDDNGHGTHLAGVIAASANNAIGIAGIASNARILPVKVLDGNGYGTYANIADGIMYATNMGARVINLGFGGTGSSKAMEDAVNYALLHNVLLVAAAGNSGDATTFYPAGYSGVVAVSAADSNQKLAAFSSTGDDVSLAAPGVGVISTGLGASYATMSGASMAAAQVSGVGALLAGQTRFSDMMRLRSALLGGALDLGSSGLDPEYGYGMLQAMGAISYSGPIIPVTINQNGVPYVLTGGVQSMNTAPDVSITAPADSSTFAQGALVSFTGTATDFEDGDLGSVMVWYSNLTGPIGTGTSVSTTNLMPGTHIISAQATDTLGDKGVASITIAITGSSGPHGGFYGNTDQCVICHRTHGTEGDAYLTTDPNSVLTSDGFCLSCHTNVSTHSNQDWTGAVEPHFELRCVQCHDAHGTSNLFDIRPNLITSLGPPATSGPIAFTSLTGTGSYDDGASANRLCVTCHTSTTNHPGGPNHFDGIGYSLDYTGLSCVACHSHNADTDPATLDGFMPVRTTNP